MLSNRSLALRFKYSRVNLSKGGLHFGGFPAVQLLTLRTGPLEAGGDG